MMTATTERTIRHLRQILYDAVLLSDDEQLAISDAINMLRMWDPSSMMVRVRGLSDKAAAADRADHSEDFVEGELRAYTQVMEMLVEQEKKIR